MKFSNKFLIKISSILFFVIFIAFSCSKNSSNTGSGVYSRPPMPVETVMVSEQSVLDRFEAVGTIEADKAITVVAEIDASIISLPYKEGDSITRGEVIAKLDDSQLKAEADRAAALRDLNKASYDRIKNIVDQGAAAPQELDDASAALKVAEANLAFAKARLAKTLIMAPFNGVLGSRRISPGAFVRAGQAITDLTQIEEIRVHFSVPERFLSKLKLNSEVTVSTTAYPGYELKGRVNIIEPALDPNTRSARVIAQVKNPGGRFRAGMSANVSAVLAERQNSLTIPNEAVFAEGANFFVFVIKDDSTVTRTPLTLGLRLPGSVEVLKGLEPGMRVVRAGHQKLFEGAKVMPISSHASQPVAQSKS
jgi:membrane fusion protein (multidrug efflux system)